jgi:phosphoadenosine phosphosulfate reductase
MLIPSDRHRADDLTLWADLEDADRLHGVSDRVRRLADRSVEEIRRFAHVGPCHLCWSGGKDSTALLAVAEAAGLLASAPVVWFRAVPKHNPDVPVVLAAVEARFGVRVEVVDYDSPYPAGMTRLEAEAVASRNFLAACRAYGRRRGRRVIGVRADESRARRLRMRHWGLSSPGSCTPLGWWRSADVFGLLAANDLPVHPAYAMLGGGRWPRERLRVDALGGERGDEAGRAEWEAEYYGDAIRRLGAGR